ncbi:UDP-N-acetylmuramoyl-L-alanine--D-glutamate ligase [Candidatus Poriferisodalis sp.]|uniref:UDP-N-acetylmuramoyl-L-alanine--D-glutamate ligase n=1 Tax=Candidatus Poriferisodalis sp. TaxID=3101277 RepID=UPI003B0268C6
MSGVTSGRRHRSDQHRSGLHPAQGPVVVVGMGVTGCAVATALAARGHEVIAADDRPAEATVRLAQTAAPKVAVHDAGDGEQMRSLLAGAAAVVPAPGVPPRHLCYTLAAQAGLRVVSELDLAAQWDRRPLAAITGTNGKTTVTTLTERMLNRSGITSLSAGNTDIALVEAIDRDVSTFVVEASSFRLHGARSFAPRVAAWLNLAPDHLDWHGDLHDYAASKARIWAAQGTDDVAVVPFGDREIAPWTAHVRSRRVTFPTPEQLEARCDVRYERGMLTAHGRRVVALAAMPRRRPHDLSNAAAATAVAWEMGASAEAIAAELQAFDGLPHRLARAGSIGEVDFHDDSKSTAPHSTVAALRGFRDAVLIAGGRNKGLDLGDLAAIAGHVHAVVAIGEAADDVADCFGQPGCGQVRVARAASMPEAVEIAYRMAQPHRAVVLSPGCASFDWYANYRERGRHFSAAVADLAARLGTRRGDGAHR